MALTNPLKYSAESSSKPLFIKEPPVKKVEKKKEEPKKQTQTASSRSSSGIGMNFNRFMDNDVVITSGSSYEPKPGRKKKTTTDGIVVAKEEQSELNELQTNEPYKNKYVETDAILKTAIAQIDMGLNELQQDISEIRASKNLRGKYNYLSAMQGTAGQFIGNKISAARELNNTITKCNELELRRYKDLMAVNQKDADDDKAIMQLYNAYVSTPINTGMNPLGPSSMDATLMGGTNGNIVTANVGGNSDAGFSNYLSTLTPEQNMMFLENNPNIKTVVVYNAATGARYFDVIDTTTGQSVPNADIPGQMLLENVTIDRNNNIARDNDLNITYPLVVVGNDAVINEY